MANTLSEEMVRFGATGVMEMQAQIDGMKSHLDRYIASGLAAEAVSRNMGRSISSALKAPAASQAGGDSASAVIRGIGESAAKTLALTRSVAGGVMAALGTPSAFFYQTFSNLRSLSRQLTGVAEIARRLAFGGGLGLAGIITGAARGTIEGQRFADTIHYLTRVLGDAFAPYVRAVTAGLMELAQWFRNLSTETRESVAQWALITAGALAFVSTLPMIVRGVGSVAAIFSLLTSPAVLLVGTFAVIVVAATRVLDSFSGGGADPADALNQSNESWLGSLLKAIQWATVQVAKFFNFVANFAQDVASGLSMLIAKAGELSGAVPKGTFDEIMKLDKAMLENRKPVIDVGGIEDFFAKVKRGAVNAQVDFNDLIGKLQEGGGLIDRIRQKANFGQGFHLQAKVEFESLQGTFDRLQKTLASQAGVGIEQQQLLEQKAANEKLQGILGGVQKIGDLVPAVR